MDQQPHRIHPLGDHIPVSGGTEMSWLLDPRIFNYVILTLYVLNAARWAWQRSLADTCYWLSAFAITATVTFLYKH